MVSYEELQILVTLLKNLKESDYTPESWALFNDALNAANAVGQTDPADTIKAAYNALFAAWQGLELKGIDMLDVLAIFVGLFDKLEENAFTVESWAPFGQALEHARKLVQEGTASYEEANDALDALLKIHQKLVADKSGGLRQLIAEAKRLLETPEEYYSGSVEKLQQALKAAEDLLKTPLEELEQVDIDNAAKALMDAISTLFEKGDIAPLQTMVRYANMLKEERYTPNSWAPFSETLKSTEARVVENDMLPDEVAERYAALRSAIENLVVKANPSGLAGAISVVESILANREQYIPSTLEGLDEALAQAKAIYGNVNAAQAEVDKMAGDLMALAVKVRKPANKAALKAALGYAGRMAGVNQAALEEAERVLTDPQAPQETVDAAKAAVDEAMRAAAGITQLQQEPSSVAEPVVQNNAGNSPAAASPVRPEIPKVLAEETTEITPEMTPAQVQEATPQVPVEKQEKETAYQQTEQLQTNGGAYGGFALLGLIPLGLLLAVWLGKRKQK